MIITGVGRICDDAFTETVCSVTVKSNGGIRYRYLGLNQTVHKHSNYNVNFIDLIFKCILSNLTISLRKWNEGSLTRRLSYGNIQFQSVDQDSNLCVLSLLKYNYSLHAHDHFEIHPSIFVVYAMILLIAYFERGDFSFRKLHRFRVTPD